MSIAVSNRWRVVKQVDNRLTTGVVAACIPDLPFDMILSKTKRRKNKFSIDRDDDDVIKFQLECQRIGSAFISCVRRCHMDFTATLGKFCRYIEGIGANDFRWRVILDIND